MAEMNMEQLAALDKALADVRAERHRQHARWGQQDIPLIKEDDVQHYDKLEKLQKETNAYKTN